jgi:hypothetical protein
MEQLDQLATQKYPLFLQMTLQKRDGMRRLETLMFFQRTQQLTLQRHTTRRLRLALLKLDFLFLTKYLRFLQISN